MARVQVFMDKYDPRGPEKEGGCGRVVESLHTGIAPWRGGWG